eukprot:gene2505-2810_t
MATTPSIVAYPHPGAVCSGAASKTECKKQPGCVWCTAPFAPSAMGNCYDESSAKYLPKQWYECSEASRGEAAVDADVKKGIAQVAVRAVAVPAIFKCKAPKESSGVAVDDNTYPLVADGIVSAKDYETTPIQEVGAPAPVAYPGPPYPGPPAPVVSCSGATAKEECLDLMGCVWCVSSFGPVTIATCYDEMAAKTLPPMFYKCKGPKKPSDDNEGGVVPAA